MKLSFLLSKHRASPRPPERSGGRQVCYRLACRLTLLLMGPILTSTGCREDRSAVNFAALPQRAYVWQRDWNPAVAQSLLVAADVLAGAVVLATEVEWRDGKPRPIRPDVDWESLRKWGHPVGVAMRVAPYPGPFAQDDSVIQELCTFATHVVSTAGRHQVPLTEFQLDFDCAQKKLAGYRVWVEKIRDAVKPLPLVITTLPSWLGESDFVKLIHEVPRYVLQVHSVSSPIGDERTMICDPELARQWVAKAGALGRPFEVALPTYRSVLGYGPDGKLLGVSSDGVRPSWPAGTVVRDYETDADALAGLVDEWTKHRPQHMEGLLWYRLPIGSDVNNWRWPTLRAVMAGRTPKVAWKVMEQGMNPADLILRNDGETEKPFKGRVELKWTGASRATAEALPGWKATRGAGSVTFSPVSPTGLRLPPGSERAMGWLRLDPAVPFHAQAFP